MPSGSGEDGATDRGLLGRAEEALNAPAGAVAGVSGAGPSPRLKSGSARRSSAHGGSVSVINLKQSVDNLPHRASSSGDLAKGRYVSPNR